METGFGSTHRLQGSLACFQAAFRGCLADVLTALVQRRADAGTAIEFERHRSAIGFTTTPQQLFGGVRTANSGVYDLPPPSRTSVKVVKSVNQENDGHEEEQIQ